MLWEVHLPPLWISLQSSFAGTVNNEAVSRETKAYEKIPDILDFLDKDGNDTMQAEIEHNYNQIKADVKQIVAIELKRIEEDPELAHLLKKEKNEVRTIIPKKCVPLRFQIFVKSDKE